jgi:hypothetical protein
MTHWLFDAGAEGWDVASGFTWDAASQSLTAQADDGNAPSTGITGLSEVVSPGDPFGFRLRLVVGTADPGDSAFTMALDGGLGQTTDNINIAVFPYDNIFAYYSGTVDAAGTVTAIDFDIAWTSPQALTVYLDEVYLNELPPSGSPDARYLGIAADFGHVYLTSITGGSLTWYSVPLAGTAAPTPTADGTATFGTAAYTDPDTFTRGLYPVVRPGADGVVYVHGRDGSNRQVLLNDLSGTLGFVDVGPGTATWGTAKFCVALMPSQLEPEDVIAAFYDNDIYLIQGFIEGSAVYGTSWGKQGDNPTSIRTAARHPTTPDSLYLAGTTTGTINMSVALGAGAFVSIGGTVVTGTINAIEVSL